MQDAKGIIRVAAVGDLHCTAASRGEYRPLLTQIAEAADVLALCGDLTQTGLVEEAQILAPDLSSVTIPIIAVLGNHDVEAGQADQLVAIFREAGVKVLDGSSTEIYGIGFAGTKGFGGGFHGKVLVAWGEPTLKQFVQEAMEEAAKLDAALAQLKTTHRIALLHYAPVRETVMHESPEIFPFMGSSYLEPPLNRHHVTAVFHGHAHHGSEEGHTMAGVPVYNVAHPLLRKLHPEHPYRLLSISIAP